MCDLLQKTMAAVTPMNPKKGADAGHFSSWTSAMADKARDGPVNHHHDTDQSSLPYL